MGKIQVLRFPTEFNNMLSFDSAFVYFGQFHFVIALVNLQLCIYRLGRLICMSF